MGLFNFIETFFFISLGITFMLILLLVYHFKQRLNAIEQKSNTMFEIINNIVSEITSIKQPRHEFMVNKLSNTNSNNIKEYIPALPAVNTNNIQFKISESDTDESVNDTDSEIGDLEDNESDSDNSEMNDSVDSVDSVYIDKIIVSDNDEPVIVNTEQVKIISLQLTDLELDSLDKTSDFKTIIKKEINEIAEISEIKEMVAKTPKELLMDTYNKMSSTELKTIVIQKGLNTDPSKMKRPKLMQLLEKSINE